VKIEVLLFAAARERAGAEKLTVDLPAGATAADLWRRLAADRPALAAVLPSCRAAVNKEFAPMSATLRDGAVVAVLPPVSGG
jgi:molybdopterin converting factor subunit 1